ncbi:hypothetical protein B0H16DRAFT_1585203 [Mycena metata]|uniref:RNase III domain-containing protein n=1 Tax=Mycena metata TaxID=1033252 RepID=A0AAD7HYC9_9AGAR|nr:hypothetical protein B0H16DRAFT_1645786 [Mycena metata]KAJ7730468.1 hypothetical protein B0H16DRAFT_1585203 [Mycena metata]
MPNPFFGPGERRLFDDCCRRIYHYLKHRHPGEFLKWEEPSHRQGVVADSHPIRSGLEHLGDSVLSDAASFLFEYLCPGKEALYKVLKAALTCNCVLGYLMYFLGYHDLTADKIGGDTWETFLGSLLLSLPYSNVIEWALPVLEPLAIVCLEVLDPDFKYTSSGPPALQQVPLSCVDTPVPVGDATTDEAAEELGPLLEYLAAFKTPCTLIAPDRAIPSCMTSFPPTTGQQEPSVLNALGSGAQATCPPAQEYLLAAQRHDMAMSWYHSLRHSGLLKRLHRFPVSRGNLPGWPISLRQVWCRVSIPEHR